MMMTSLNPNKTTKFFHEEVNVLFTKVLSSDSGNLFVNPELRVAVCEMTVPYVAIEEFKNIFLQSSEHIIKHNIKKFIFDKRSLQAFHQPSMEWYFLEWKKEMYEQGLTVHRKILPDELWFQKCVEAGRKEIDEKHPQNIIKLLDIAYKPTIAESIHF